MSEPMQAKELFQNMASAYLEYLKEQGRQGEIVEIILEKLANTTAPTFAECADRIAKLRIEARDLGVDDQVKDAVEARLLALPNEYKQA